MAPPPGMPIPWVPRSTVQEGTTRPQASCACTERHTACLRQPSRLGWLLAPNSAVSLGHLPSCTRTYSLEFRSCPTSHQCDLGQGLVPSVNQGHHSVSALGCCQEVVQGEGRGAPAASGPPPKCSLGLLQGLRGRHVGGIPSQVQVHPRPKAPSSDSRKMVGSPGRGGGLGVHPGYAAYGTSR